MANAFKNGYLDITSSAQTIYTVPASTETIVMSLRITNVNGTASDYVTADVIDGTSGNSRIAYQLTIPADTSVDLIENKIVLEATDYIQLSGGQASGYLEALISVVEITA